jgi:hypothetical protein
MGLEAKHGQAIFCKDAHYYFILRRAFIEFEYMLKYLGKFRQVNLKYLQLSLVRLS